MTIATLPPALFISSLSPTSPSTSTDVAFSDQSQHLNRQRTANIHLAFYGLPIEIIQLISAFLPFHDLVNVYKSVPKLHRPKFQHQLDHSLALMILTLEIRQNHGKPVHPFSMPDTPSTILQTCWRATGFDPEEMKVDFQLEEKLGFEIEEKRRILSCSSSFFSLQNEKSNRNNNGSNTTTTATPATSVGVGEGSVDCGSIEENIEDIIWKSRSRLMSSRRRLPLELTMTPTQTSDFPDNNFFHCNRSKSSPIIDSATISFKAHRNVPAPWIAQQRTVNSSLAVTATTTTTSGRSQYSNVNLSSILSSTSSSSSSSKSLLDSQRAQCAREKIAAFQQNRILLKSLHKNQGLQESRSIQFLRTKVKLDTHEIGKKRVKGFVGKPRFPRLPKPEDGKADSCISDLPTPVLPDLATTSTLDVSMPATPTNVRRRHSWHILGDLSRFAPSSTTDLPPTSVSTTASPPDFPSESDEPYIGPSGLSTVLKRLLKKRPSWSGPSSSYTLPGPSSEDANATNHSVADNSGNLGAGDWKSMLSAMASSVPFFRNNDTSSSNEGDYAGDKGGNRCNIIIRSFNGDQESTKRKSLKGSEDEKELFELVYDVRHDYVISNSIEGERVIRPLSFSCTLDFFQQV